jgi:hypothetical protein
VGPGVSLEVPLDVPKTQVCCNPPSSVHVEVEGATCYVVAILCPSVVGPQRSKGPVVSEMEGVTSHSYLFWNVWNSSVGTAAGLRKNRGLIVGIATGPNARSTQPPVH